MSDKPKGPLSKLLGMPNDSIAKTLFVAIALCLVCSIVVSMAAVVLKPLQISNKLLDKQRNILAVAGLLKEGETRSVEELFAQVETRIVNLETGEYVTDIDPKLYDQRRAASDPKQNIVIPADKDIASVRRRAKNAFVYLVKSDSGDIEKIILPVHGYGLWSTLYGFLALDATATTVEGLKFYEHKETPGLGGEVDNPKWQSLWRGKKLYGEDNGLKIQVVKGNVSADTPNAVHKIDGLAGATLTSNGVTNMMRYWLGEHGFGPYLDKFDTGV